jgi:glycolate oxidase FAD binding subunit
MIKALVEQVQDAAARRAALTISGGNSKGFYGLPVKGESLSTRALTGVLSYEPTELMIHVRSGTPISQVESLLAEKNQTLPFEPPHFGPSATIGGCIAAGLSGPARVSAGAARDFVLGVTLLDGRGEVLGFGGQVMKNVAGYDVSRLVTGSLGTLGVLLDVSLKVLPRPQSTRTLVQQENVAKALASLHAWRSRALPITGSAWHDERLTLRLAGAPSAVDAAVSAIGGEVLDDALATHFWHDLREQKHAFFAGTQPLWRVALPAGSQEFMEQHQLIEWGGMQRWLRGELDAPAIRARAAAAGGHATLFRASDQLRLDTGVFTPLSKTLNNIHRSLKQRFDPAGIFNPARMYPHL